ncbi:chemotaxis response regulator protein-glutamate methylesterase [Zavarzinia sp.]|uniref:protein-glutamate methylesterase/protein-glutamine glutaminase n=1 Tax=Zavarzinia sp. TaxID=2027920 RepID=UPI003566A725
MAGAEPTGDRPADDGPLRVMLVDDSAVIRGMVGRWLEAEPDIEVVATAANGALAVRQVARANPEVVILDIEMPEMDGLTALPEILKQVRGVRVLMSSTLTRAGAEVSMKALTLGAADYLTKPSSTREAGTVDAFRAELVAKVRALGQAARRRNRLIGRPAVSAAPAPAPAFGIAKRPPPPAPAAPAVVALRAPGTVRPQVIAIGSSTGGPQALAAVLGTMAQRVEQPILITQHMPATFTAILAEHLARSSGVPAAEGVDGEAIQGRRIYVAPGNRHMLVDRSGNQRVIRLTDDPPENFCRPSVDPMLRSIAAAYGPAVLTVILTGMGQDGLVGGRAIVAAGGTVLAQDEASSVVWGMPGAVATAGICAAVLPLGEIGAAVERMARGPLLAGVR